jgi:PqqD family protein of HPr-rel-A system
MFAVVRAADLETRNAGEVTIVHQPSAGRVHVLNRTAADILEFCSVPVTAQAVAAFVCDRYEVAAGQASGDVDSIVATLASLGLLREAGVA